MALLSVNKVSIIRRQESEGRVKDIEILSDISFTINNGECLSIVGASGCGKSSLLRTLNRMDEISAGEILFNEINIRKYDPVMLRRKIALVSQNPVVFDATVAVNMAYPAVVKGEKLKKDDAVNILAEMGLSQDFLDRNARELSGGQAHRTAIARSLIMNPDILLLDEPTAALDDESKEIILTMLKKRIKNGLAVIIVTHDVNMAKISSDKVLMINAGKSEIVDNVL